MARTILLRKIGEADLSKKITELEQSLDKHIHNNTGSQKIPANAISDGTVSGSLQSQNFITGTTGSGWKISADGDLEASSGNFRGDITGATGTFSGSLTIGSGNNVVKADGSSGLWVGNSTFGSAPFRVSLAGALTASSATITGAITATTLTATGTGYIGGWAIGSTTLTGGGVTLDSAGTITGGTIQTALTGERVVIDSSGIDSFDDSDNLRVTLFRENLIFKDAAGATVATLGSTVDGYQVLSTSTVTIAVNNNIELYSDFNDTGSGSIVMGKRILPSSDSVDIGSTSTNFRDIHHSVSAMVDGITAPGTVSGRAQIYVDSADGDLKVKFGDGFVRVIAADS